MKRLLLFIIPLFLWSCADEAQLQEMTEKERLKAEELASIIQDAYNHDKAAVLSDYFDAIEFSKRVRIPELRPGEKPPQIVLNIIHQMFETFNNNLFEHLAVNTSKLNLLHIHKKDDVIRLTYILENEESFYNYLVFYISPNSQKEFEIANIYSVYDGLSLGQNVNQFASRYGSNSMIFLNGLMEANNIYLEAESYMNQGDFKKAYQLLDSIDDKHKNVQKYAASRLRLSEYVDSDTYKKELQNMQSISPNRQSKLLYQCIIDGLDNEDEERYIECFIELENLLFET
ncbi:MAG: hypothetical protein ABJN73_13115 [Nonlabens ulvanivorans]|uniref:hypothetical protein n=3 Tax=Nonlabens ulvanivorans TaxID=906888 RepID=UPI003266DB42